jgi:peptidyl-prolyl cis-trans isomerase C
MAIRLSLVAIASAAALCAGLAAAELPPDVLTRSSRATLTRADVETDLESVPADRRADFVANRTRLAALINALLEIKTLAAEARANGLDKDPLVQRRAALQVERALAFARRDQIEREAGAEFDRRRDDFVVRAREIYALDKARFTVPEQVRAAHILVKIDSRGKDEALKLAQEIRARVLADKVDFSALAREYSDDRTVATNGGHLGWFSAAQMDPAFSAGAFALQKPGDISEPVLSSFGYHVIRLEARKPAEVLAFDKVRDAILADVRQEYIAAKKTAAMKGISGDPTLEINQPAIDALSSAIGIDSLPAARP